MDTLNNILISILFIQLILLLWCKYKYFIIRKPKKTSYTWRVPFGEYFPRFSFWTEANWVWMLNRLLQYYGFERILQLLVALYTDKKDENGNIKV